MMTAGRTVGHNDRTKGIVRRFGLWIVTGMAFATATSIVCGAVVGLLEGARIDGVVRAIAGGALAYFGAVLTFLPIGLPLFASASGLWVFLAQAFPSIESQRTWMVLGLAMLGLVITWALHMATAEPSSWYVLPMLWSCLLGPRILVRRLGPSAFSPLPSSATSKDGHEK